MTFSGDMLLFGSIGKREISGIKPPKAKQRKSATKGRVDGNDDEGTLDPTFVKKRIVLRGGAFNSAKKSSAGDLGGMVAVVLSLSNESRTCVAEAGLRYVCPSLGPLVSMTPVEPSARGQGSGRRQGVF